MINYLWLAQSRIISYVHMQKTRVEIQGDIDIVKTLSVKADGPIHYFCV